MLDLRLVICSAALATVGVVEAASSNRDGGMSAGVCSGTGANPGTYNFMVNGYPAKIFNDAIDFTALEGGWYNEDPAVLKRALQRRFLNATAVHFDNNVMYVDWDGEGVLFDCGAGPDEAPSFAPGMLFEHLDNEGIARDSIKHVMITHAHHDHIQGLVEDLESLKPAYPSAKVYMSRVEYEYWTAETVRTRSYCVCAVSLVFSINTLCKALKSYSTLALFCAREETVHTGADAETVVAA
jgi:hypothetical protein